MIMSLSKVKSKPVKLKVDGRSLPRVEKTKFLGCLWSAKLDGLSEDNKIKRSMFVNKNVQINQ